MFENKFISNLENKEMKEKLQHDLYRGVEVYYSSNARGIPNATHVENIHHFIINPSQYQLAFTDFKLLTIDSIIKNIYCQDDMDEMRRLWLTDIKEFKQIIKEDSQQQNQYTYEDIEEYLVLLFNIEEEMSEYNFKNEDNKQEAIRIILSLAIKSYEIEAEKVNRLVNNYLCIKIKDNNFISGEINISLDENYNGYKDIKLINDYKKELLKNDLNITCYGEITNEIKGSLPFNIKLKV